MELHRPESIGSLRHRMWREHQARLKRMKLPLAKPNPPPKPGSRDILWVASPDWVLSLPQQWETKHERIIRRVCQFYGISKAELCGPRRHKALVEARFVCVHLLATLLPRLSMSQLGTYLDRDHSSILNAKRSMQQRIDAGDAKLAATVAALTDIINGQQKAD